LSAAHGTRSLASVLCFVRPRRRPSSAAAARSSKQVKRRANGVGIFPDEASIRPIGAAPVQNDEGQLQHRYMQGEEIAEPAVPATRRIVCAAHHAHAPRTECGVDGTYARRSTRRRGQAPQPRSGAPKAQGLTAAIAVVAQSRVPSIAQQTANFSDATIHNGASTTSQIYTSLTDLTPEHGGSLARSQHVATRPHQRSEFCPPLR